MPTTRAFSIVLAAVLAVPVMPASAQDYKANTVWGEVPEAVKANAAHVELQGTAGEVSGIAQIGNDGKFSFENVLPGTYYAVVDDTSRNGLAQSRVVVSHAGAVHVTTFDGLCASGTPFVDGTPNAVMPAQAREYGPDTIWGWVPGADRSKVAAEPDKKLNLRAVLETADGHHVATVAVLDDGSFAFRNVARGHYYVSIEGSAADGTPATSTGERARSWEISFASGTTRMAVFANGCAALLVHGAGPTPAVAAAGGHTALVIAGAAAAAGITTVILVTKTDPTPASGSR